MFGRYRDEEPHSDLQEVEEVSDDATETQNPNFSDDLNNSIHPLKKDDAFMLIDSDGEIWLAMYNGTELSITPANLTPMVVK